MPAVVDTVVCAIEGKRIDYIFV